jgi:hemerythrin
MGIDWSSSLETGHPVIDSDHKHIIGYINELLDSLESRAPRVIIEDVLMEFCSHFIHHFYMEEGLMIDSNFYNYQRHKAEHRQLMDRLEDLMRRFDRSRTISKEFLQKFVIEVANHIQIHDKELAQAVQSVRPPAQPRAAAPRALQAESALAGDKSS